MDENRYYGQTTAERPWSGGRPWHGFLGQGDPDPDLCGTGPELAAALGVAADAMGGADLGEVGPRARARLVDIAVAAERTKAWATAVQAEAVAALQAQLMAEHDLAAAGPGDDIDPEDRDHRPNPDNPRKRQHRCRVAPPAPTARSEWVAFEQAGRATSICLSLALGVSIGRADRILGLALGLAEQPVLAEALAAGRLDEAQARVILDATAALPVQTRTVVVDSVAADPDTLARASMVKELRCGTRMVWEIPAHQLRPILARQIARHAPETVKPAEQAAREDRRVTHRAGTIDCAGQVVLHGPEHQLAAIYHTLDRDARAARTAGAPQTLDQLRFDLAAAHLTDGAFGLTITRRPAPSPADAKRAANSTNGASSTNGTSSTNGASGAGSASGVGSAAGREIVLPKPGRTILVEVVVSAATLLGLDDTPAVLRTPTGDVPISADLAHELAHDQNATWRRILADPTTGTATDVSPGYQPGRETRRLLPGPRRPHLTLPHQQRPPPRARPHPRIRPPQPRRRRTHHRRQPRQHRQTRPPSQNRPPHHRHRQRQHRASPTKPAPATPTPANPTNTSTPTHRPTR